MTPMERIKKFEAMDLQVMSLKDIYFEASHLLKSFYIMKKIAIDWRNSDCENNGIEPDGEKLVEEEFDQKMDEKKGKR